MPATPGVTLTADLQTIEPGGTLTGGYLRITLCGFGPQIPAVPGTCVLADGSVPQVVGPQGASALTVTLWGNDQIQPPNTFYEVAVLDKNQNAIQSGMYVFNSTPGNYDLSSAAQILPPFNMGFVLNQVKYLPCTGALVGGNQTFVAPGPVVAVTYNGVLLQRGVASPALSYTLASDNVTITLNFSPELGDRIDAICLAP